MANIQVRIDDSIKAAADSLFYSLGMDTSTAVRMFISSALDNNGLPFEVKKAKPDTTKHDSRFSKEYIAKVKGFCEDPDPTLMEQPEPHFNDRGELFE